MTLTAELGHLLSMQRGRRGTPGNRLRRRLEHAAVREMQRANISLTKGRDGMFAKTLIVMSRLTANGRPKTCFRAQPASPAAPVTNLRIYTAI